MKDIYSKLLITGVKRITALHHIRVQIKSGKDEGAKIKFEFDKLTQLH
jgi:hypothetical protein